MYNRKFHTLSVDILYADVWEGNINSMKSLESYGYQLIAVENDIFSKTEMCTRKYIYSLSKADYFAHRKKLDWNIQFKKTVSILAERDPCIW